MPKLEMSQETALVIEWLKREGDHVEKGEPILNVETDKITMDIEAQASGILSEVRVKAGDVVPVTSIIASILVDGESLPDSSKVESKGVFQAIAAPDSKGVEITKNTPPVSPVASRIAENNNLNFTDLVGSGPRGKIIKADVERALTKKQTQEQEVPTEKVRATPAARRVSGERGFDLEEIPGSGPRSRIHVEDVLNYSPQAIASESAADYEEIIPLVGNRKTIAQRMQSSYQTAPHIMFTTRVDMSAFEALRATINQFADSEKAVHISVTAMLVKVVTWALKQYPWLNSSLQGEEIHLYPHVNMGVAVALPGSLIVAVIREADQKSLSQIALETKQLVELAQQGKLTLSDVTQGTFTISNLGPFGIEQFTAILNPGQAGILAIGATQPEAVVIENEILIRPIMRITLSVDHRVVDGSLAAQFSATLRKAIENPGLIIW